MSKNLLDLPVECIHKILTFIYGIKANRSVLSFLLVNKRLHDIILPILWKYPPLGCESVIQKYLNELDENEQKTLIPFMINLPPPTLARPKCAANLMNLDLRDLNVACVRLLVSSGRICECGELTIVRSMVSSIILMILRTNKNLQKLSLLISKDEPDFPDVSIFSSSQPGLSNLRSLHLSLMDMPMQRNIRNFIDEFPNLCSNLQEISLDFFDNDTDEAITMSLTNLIDAQRRLSTLTLCRCTNAQSYPRDFSRLYRRAAENSENVFTRSNIYEIYNLRNPSLRKEPNPTKIY
ncbi:11658_t:CDS:2 [Cetraspora pellucida]|uniref:11658_t:CDS:1 n=1 Tax=Cetraspora pellucida TaxID=1433469 RepID=A0ACA9KG99_9GLOM|nr:11658_t:CDS:2 [Cetraspora pellucida]